MPSFRYCRDIGLGACRKTRRPPSILTVFRQRFETVPLEEHQYCSSLWKESERRKHCKRSCSATYYTPTENVVHIDPATRTVSVPSQQYINP
jgi:hypothetical protein